MGALAPTRPWLAPNRALAAARRILTGHLTEMATGEGKTGTTALAACTAALPGLPVHVVTVHE
jgi:preprotein translocase subunit SecA